MALFGCDRRVGECLLLREAKRTCRLFRFGQPSALLLPLDRELFEQIVELKSGRMFAFEDGFYDLGCEQGETQDAAKVAQPVDAQAEVDAGGAEINPLDQ